MVMSCNNIHMCNILKFIKSKSLVRYFSRILNVFRDDIRRKQEPGLPLADPKWQSCTYTITLRLWDRRRAVVDFWKSKARSACILFCFVTQSGWIKGWHTEIWTGCDHVCRSWGTCACHGLPCLCVSHALTCRRRRRRPFSFSPTSPRREFHTVSTPIIKNAALSKNIYNFQRFIPTI